MTGPIYVPKGRALEYSPLALNLYSFCLHGCKYCYVPGTWRMKRTDFNRVGEPKKDLLDRLEKQCKKMKGDTREILLCFGSDPYQPLTPSLDITREALLVLEKYDMRVQILTKGGMRATRDFDILKRNGWKFGTTLLFYSDPAGDELEAQWEPNAASVNNRIMAILEARNAGVYTWVSVEPVFFASQALHVIVQLRDVVDHWKVGKLNGNKWYEDRVDWLGFLTDAMCILRDKDVYFKKDLLEAAGK